MAEPDDFGGYLALILPVAWLCIGSLLALPSGWYVLMRRYPDRKEPSILKLRWQSGAMGFGVGLRSLLTISVCRSGLRLGIFRLFGPFCRDFFVPWEEIQVTRRTYFRVFGRVRLCFGNSGKLTISRSVADRLWRAIPDRWPEHGDPPAKIGRLLFINI